jgi:hypothetical protein
MLRERSRCLVHRSARSRWSDSKDNSDGGAAVAASASSSWCNTSDNLSWTAQARIPVAMWHRWFRHMPLAGRWIDGCRD